MRNFKRLSPLFIVLCVTDDRRDNYQLKNLNRKDVELHGTDCLLSGGDARHTIRSNSLVIMNTYTESRLKKANTTRSYEHR